MAQEVSFVVDKVGLSIEDGGAAGGVVALLELFGDVGEDGFGVELVACVEEDDVVAFGLLDGFVHGVVQPVVGFAHENDGMGVALVGIALYVLLDQSHGVVGGAAVNDEVLKGAVSLCCHALQGALEGFSGVIGDGGDGETEQWTERLSEN